MGIKTKVNTQELEALLKQDLKPGRMQRIADHFGLKLEQMRKVIKKAGLPARPVFVDAAQLEAFLREDREPDRYKRAAEKFGVLIPTLLSYSKNLSEDVREPHDPKPWVSPQINQEELIKLLESDPGTLGRNKRIAKQLGVSVPAVQSALKAIGAPKISSQTEEYKTQVGLLRQRQIHGCLNKTRNYRKDPRQNLVREAMHRALQKDMDFDLHPSDIAIPEACPVLGIPIVVGAGKFHPNCPNLDRVNNNRGYVWDNVLVISCRANGIKKDATPEELRKLADFYTAYENPTTRNPIVPIKASSKYSVTPEEKTSILKDFEQGMKVKPIAHKYDISCRLAWEITHPDKVGR